ncbi:MAG: response regulator [Candidatus Margulisbacteria bacterium]|nr:response regulator [Candidatus Margulisiibacteriota bacterium]
MDHILVIDDQASMRSIICHMLEDKGYKVTCAQDGQEGWDYFEKDPDTYKLVVADVNMPKVDGFELLKRIRQTHPNKPVVFLTGINEDIVKIVGQEYQVNAIIKKPFQVEDALAIIEDVIASNP